MKKTELQLNRKREAKNAIKNYFYRDKAPREEWKKRCYYNNGALNNQFLAFLAGYSAGKCVGACI